MSDKTQTQHEQLIQAGWIYDPDRDRYASPGSPTDGTARLYNLAAAWQAYTSGATPLPPIARRAPDPRAKEPE